jgi:hypothetical protein
MAKLASGGELSVPQSNLLVEDEFRLTLWTLDADAQASATLGRAAVQALTALSADVKIVPGASLDEELVQAARFDEAATRRVIDILDQTRARLLSGLDEKQMENALEQALLRAAARLPDMEDAEGLLRAG